MALSTRSAKTDEITTTQELDRSGCYLEFLVVAIFVLFSGMVAYIVRPRDRRRSRRARQRPVALKAAASSEDSSFHERRGRKAPTDRWAHGDESE
jgi:cbb3-type cytochrome oxidase subunit 3